MIIDVVVATFKDNLLPCSHALRFSNSMFVVLVKSLTSFAECARLVSSALIVREHFNANYHHHRKFRFYWYILK